MTSFPYATAAELSTWIAPVELPDKAPQMLRSASYVVAEACNRNPYTDVPTGTDVPVLRDATLAQAASWIALGMDPDALGIDGPAPVKRTTILGATVEHDTSARDQARTLAARELAPQAEQILTAAGLIWVALPLADTSGALQTFGLSSPRSGFVSAQLANELDWPFA